ncbi:MAG: hypothetical protein WC236_09345 [Gallionellaceae bacterium]|jgi:hypothetical protein
MNDISTQHDIQAANAAAKRIVRHFQGAGFTRITEATLIQIQQIAGDQAVIEEAFEAAQEQGKAPPASEYFKIHPYGHYSEHRSFDEAKSSLQSDVTWTLVNGIPQLFFGSAPVLIDDPLASGLKYDVMMKLDDNVDCYAVAILLNDPDASFIDYVGTHPGADWQKIMGELVIATTSLAEAVDLP